MDPFNEEITSGKPNWRKTMINWKPNMENCGPPSRHSTERKKTR
jgi:hypothetical protein